MATALMQIVQTRTAEETAPVTGAPALDARARERELVLLCSRAGLGPAQLDRVAAVLGRTLDWRYVYGIAHRNGVLPLVCKNLTEHFSDSLSPETSAMLSEFLTEHTRGNIFITGKLLEAVKMLDAAGIPSLPFKGPTLAARIYENLALRQFVDLDLLVQPKHFDAAVELFLKNGFRTYGTSEPKRSSALLINRRKDIGLISADGLVRIELHWKLSGSFFALPFELKDLWNRLEKTNLGGCRVNTLPFDDLFVYLCLHGARHGFERLGWVSDLCGLIESEREIDWPAVSRHAKAHGCAKVVELGLLLCYEMFGVKTAYPGWDRIESDELLKKAAAQIRQKIFADEFSSTEIGDWYLYHLMLKEKRTDQLKLHLHYIFWYLKLALRPNALDKSIFRLPPVFSPLYYVLRPARLMFNYFTEKNTGDR